MTHGFGGHAEGDTLFDIENIEGSEHDDVITGNRESNTLIGRVCNDILRRRRCWMCAGPQATTTPGSSAAPGPTPSGERKRHTLRRRRRYQMALHGGTVSDRPDGGADSVRDTLFGGDGGDQLIGHGYGDRLFGEIGDDELVSGAGANYLDGGDGYYTASYVNSNAAVSVNLLTGNASGGDADLDQLVRIESLTGSSYADVLVGNGGNNTLLGRDGDDRLSGGSGNDMLNGGAGNDTLEGDQGADTLFGGGDQDTLMGGDGWDFLFGQNGDDLLEGGAGMDYLDGGDGVDTASYVNSSAAVQGSTC